MQERIKKINILMVDIDGVLTNGKIVYGNSGDELKFFDVQDGFGIVLLKRAGIKTIIITAKKSKIVSKRAKDFNAFKVYQNCFDKLKTFQSILKTFKFNSEEICYIGDDLIDIPVLKRVGFAVSVPNATEEVRANSHYITKKTGGSGAVREVCELILKTQGKWKSITEKYFR